MRGPSALCTKLHISDVICTKLHIWWDVICLRGGQMALLFDLYG